MTAFKVVYAKDGPQVVVNINDFDLLADVINAANAVIDGKVTQAATNATAAATAQGAAEAARDVVLAVQPAKIWPGITSGGIAFSDAAGRSGPALFNENSPAFQSVLQAITALQQNGGGGGAKIWPGITQGGIGAIDAGGKIATILTTTSGAYTDLREDVEANSNDLAEPYYAKLKTIWANAQARADAKRGFARPLVLTTFQPCEYANGANYDPLAAEAFLWVQERNDYGLFSCPTYQLPPADTVGHLIPSSYKRMGAHYGDALFDFLWTGYKRPVLRPTVERLTARELLLTFDVRPGARLVLDTSAADLKGDVLVQHGVRLCPTNDTRYVDNTNNPVPPVSIDATVKISGRNTIYIKAVADIPTDGAYEVRFGWYDCKYRNATHFRDNAGDVLPVFDPSGIATRLHNWLPISRNLIP